MDDGYFSPRFDQAAQLAQDFEFDILFDKVRLYNPSNTLPYHNWFHTCCMICNCIEGAQFYNLSFRECHLIGVSALFHDFNHSGGRTSDAENITRAIEGFRSFNNHHATLDGYQIEHTIQVTQYPFVHEPKTLEQMIIRDADLMQILEPEWFEHVIIGLQNEFRHGGKIYSLDEMLKGQVIFLDEHIPNNLFTGWARRKFDPELGSVYGTRKAQVFTKLAYLELK